MSTVGTPDWQRGVVGPQQLYGPFSSMVLAETVALPANAKSIHILQAPAAGGGIPTVMGTTTNTFYPVFALTHVAAGADNLSHIAVVDPSADPQVTVTLPAGPGSNWYVIADQSPLFTSDLVLSQAAGRDGVTGPTVTLQVGGQNAANVLSPLLIDSLGRLETADQVLDLTVQQVGSPAPADAIQVGGTDTLEIRALRMNRQGLPYTIPSAPSTVAGDHPPNELLSAAGTFAANGIFLPVVLGKRYRIFSVMCAAEVAGLSFALNSSGAVATFYVGTSLNAGYMGYGPSGVPLDTGASVNFVLIAGAGSTLVSIVYTLETP